MYETPSGYQLEALYNANEDPMFIRVQILYKQRRAILHIYR